MVEQKEIPKRYKQTEVGLIPEDWEVRELGEASSYINGRGFKPYEWSKQGLPIIRIQNLNGSDQFNYFNGTYNEKILVRQNDLLFAWSGSRGTSFGPYFWKMMKGLLNYHTWKVIVHENNNKLFLFYTLKKLTKEIEDDAHGASALVHMQKQYITSYKFPLPPLHEQKAIARVLSDTDALIESLDALINKKKAIKQGAMQELLTGKRRLPGFTKSQGYKQTEVGVIPEDWDVRKINDICEINSENLSTNTNPNFEFNYIALEDVSQGKLNGYMRMLFRDSPIRARRVIGNDDVLFGTVRPNLKSHVLFNNENLNFVCSTGFTVLRPTIFCVSKYLFNYVLSDHLSVQVNKIIAGSNYPAVSSSQVSNFLIPLPPLPEQKAIAQVLSDMDADIEELEQKRDKYKQIKQGMMEKLLTGKVRLLNESIDNSGSR